MYQQFFMGKELLDLPVLAMLMFITTFVVVVVRVWRQDPADPQLSELSKLPLDDTN